MTNKPQGQHQHGNEPNLFNPVPLNVWREVYNGRWKMLRGIQKAEFIVELAFLVFFCAFAIYAGISQSIAGTVLLWGVVIGVLLLFFFVMARFIR